MNHLRIIATLFLCGLAQAGEPASEGLLLVAHGANRGTWNDRVLEMAQKVDWPGPLAVGFLTARSPGESLQGAVTKLEQRGARRIAVVPLLVSSFSDHYEEIRYYAHARSDAPEHVESAPLESKAELVLTPAMDSDRLLGRILAEQVRAASVKPGGETVVLVAHGPNGDVDNERWLACLRVQAGYLQYALGFRHVEVTTLRDDAPTEVKSAAVAHLRQRIAERARESRVVVQPVLVSTGHLQAEIASLVKGLDCTVSGSGVVNHPLVTEWIRQQAATGLRTAAAR